MRLPIDVEMLPQSLVEDDDDTDIDEVVGAVLKSRENAYINAHENISKAQKRKETYDRKHLNIELKEGMKVANAGKHSTATEERWASSTWYICDQSKYR